MTAPPPVVGLHHVTATVAVAQDDVDFYADLLGLRLVKRTVNFDNPFVYHLYYGTELGSPGSLMTTFPYSGQGVRPGRHGTGQIEETRFSVPPGSSEWWHARIARAGPPVALEETPFGERSTVTEDPSGLVIRLVESEDDRDPWTTAEVPDPAAIRGIHSVAFPVVDDRASISFLTDLLGWTAGEPSEGLTRLSIGEGGPGRWIDIEARPGGTPGVNGLGTVHHVAMATSTEEDQLALRRQLVDGGAAVTPVKDRQYFRSIYFREPGGVLYEIATIPPGFAIDEDADSLGTSLKLPPWEEARRSEIESGLAPLRVPLRD